MFGLSVSAHRDSRINLNNSLNTFEKELSKVDCTNFNIEIFTKPFFREIQSQLALDQLRFKELREIHTIHHKLTILTESVLHDAIIKDLWKNVLIAIQYKPIYNIGHGYSKLDCTRELGLLDGKLEPRISFTSIDPSNPGELEKTVDMMVKLDAESLGNYLSRGFYKALLQSNRTSCFVAKTEEGEIVGWCWGIFAYIRDQSIFHVMGLARKADLCGLNLTHQFKLNMLNVLKQKFNPDYLTFNVKSSNAEAIHVYQKVGIQTPIGDMLEEMKGGDYDQPDLTKIEEYKIISPISNRAKGKPYPPTNLEVYNAVKSYVMEKVGYANTLNYEGMRALSVNLKRVYYR